MERLANAISLVIRWGGFPNPFVHLLLPPGASHIPMPALYLLCQIHHGVIILNFIEFDGSIVDTSWHIIVFPSILVTVTCFKPLRQNMEPPFTTKGHKSLTFWELNFKIQTKWSGIPLTYTKSIPLSYTKSIPLSYLKSKLFLLDLFLQEHYMYVYIDIYIYILLLLPV